jgi:methyl-accepting chemotaxis protein
MLRVRDFSITRKLTWMSMLVSGTALLLACGAFIAYEAVLYRQTMVRDLSVQAQIIGDNSISAVLFNDTHSAETTLGALRIAPHVLTAWIFTPEGQPFAGYGRDGNAPPPGLPPIQAIQTERYWFQDGQLVLVRPVFSDRKLTALVFIESDLRGLYDRLERFAEIGAGVLLTSLLAAFSASWLTGRVVAKPIQDLSETARLVSRDKNYAVRATPTKGRNEVGVLIDTFNSMLEQIQERDEALQKAVDSLREVNRQVRESVDVLASSASEILATTALVASGAAETATAVAETTTTVEEVKRTAQVSSQKARHVSDSAQKTAQVSQTGQKAVNETIDKMNRIREQMESIAQSIVRWSEQSMAIGAIVATVNDLADQSNLLAVNAAIEAAKAGEQGRGFAVVAHEVKSLAQQSKNATAQVRNILKDLHNSTSAAVIATEQGSKTVEAGVKQSAEAGQAVRKLTDSIAEAAQAAIQIAATAQEQLVGMDQVALAMENIRKASVQNAASTKQTEAEARNMHDLGQKLRQLVEQHKV